MILVSQSYVIVTPICSGFNGLRCGMKAEFLPEVKIAPTALLEDGQNCVASSLVVSNKFRKLRRLGSNRKEFSILTVLE